MTDTQIVPVVSWDEIQKFLPRIQMGVSGEAIMPVFVQDLTLSFDLDRQEFVLSRDRFGYLPADEVRRNDIHQLEVGLTKFLIQYYQGELEAAVRAATYQMFLQLCKQIPYPQGCQCGNYTHGQALDCHVHMDNPCHFFGDFNFTCTCDEQKEAKSAAHSS